MRVGVLVTLSAAAFVLAPAATARPPLEDRPEDGLSRSCNAGTLTIRNGQPQQLVVFNQHRAIVRPRRYGANSVLWSSVRKASCRVFWRLMMKVLAAPDELVALEQAGWRTVRLDNLEIDGADLHQLWATKGDRRIVYVRPGRDAVVDEFGAQRVYRPAQEIGFYRSSAEPDTPWNCTAGYVLRIDGAAFGLTAGHCSRYPFFPPGGGAWETESAERQDVFLGHPRRQTLGSVITNTNLSEDGPDALVFALDQVPQAAQHIERGSLTPRRVSGWLRTRRQRNGLVVCFSGRTSGMERCGRIYMRLLEGGRRVVCAHVKTTGGDSGGPVYTRPREGAVKAVGIVMASRVFFGRGDLCYTPIQTVLDRFGAEFPTGVVKTAR
jgi:hypothetical protein